jgi:polyisoprenoid-binding protein YceI
MRVALSLMAVCMLLGCEDPAAKVEPAKIEEVEAGAQRGNADFVETLSITPKNSKIDFVGSKVTKSHSGGFTDFEGEIRLAEPVTDSQIELTIQTASLFTDDPKLTKHLKSPEFFDVEKFPTASFKSSRIQNTPLGPKIFGHLTLHGETKPISFMAGIAVTDEAARAKSTFSLNRQDFGISYPGMPDDLIRDMVVIKLQLDIPRQGS